MSEPVQSRPSHRGSNPIGRPLEGAIEDAASIDDVINRLDSIVARSYQQASRLGFFAALYRTVTTKVSEGIASGLFEDGPRMARLDVAFANRYFDALNAYQNGEPASRCWLLSFQAAKQWQPLALQHLLLGINAHINLDLGIAAAEIAPGDQLSGLEQDFNQINAILSSLVSRVEKDIELVSPWIKFLDHLAPQVEGVFINFSLDKARANAWSVATRLAWLPSAQRAIEIDLMDSWVTVLGSLVLHPPGFLMTSGLTIIRARESNSVRRILNLLSGTNDVAVSARETSIVPKAD